MVATDGSLDPEQTARFAERLAGGDGKVTVVSVVEIPRRLLSDLRDAMGQRHEAGTTEGDQWVDTPAVPGESPRSWPGDDAVIKRYLDDKCSQNTGPILAILRDHGIEANGLAAEAERTAQTILEHVDSHEPDVLVIGSHGQGAFAGLLGSVGTKLVRQSPVPVLLLRD